MIKLNTMIAASLCWAALHSPVWAAPILFQSGQYAGSAAGGNALGTNAAGNLTVSNPFFPTASGSAGWISFEGWAPQGQAFTSLEWSISSGPNGAGTVFAAGVSSLSNDYQFSQGVWDVYKSTFSVGEVALSQGTTYFLTLIAPNYDGIMSWANVVGGQNGSGGSGTIFLNGSPVVSSFTSYFVVVAVPELNAHTATLPLLFGATLLLGLRRRTGKLHLDL